MLPEPSRAPRPVDDPAAVAVAVRRTRVLAARLADACAALAGDRDRLVAAWRGTAAEAARAELAASGTVLGRLPPALAAGATALAGYAEAVEEITRRLDRLDAAYAELAIGQARDRAALAAVGLPGPVRARVEEQLLAAQQAEQTWAARRVQALHDLDAVARRTGQALRAAAGEVVGARAGARLTSREAQLVAVLPMLAAQRARSVTAGRPGVVPGGGTAPELVTGWWTWLTGDERARLLRARPAAVGRLSGLPAAVLDAANRRVLARDLGGGARRSAAAAVAAALRRAAAHADPVTGGPVAVRLLGYAPGAFGGQGRVLIAVGDPDTADNLAYLVPGMDSDLVHSVGGLTGAAIRVTATARRLEPGATTATVGWLGYDAPGLLSVGSDAAAVAAAARLAGDLRAAAGRPVAPHLTVVGHSYGSVVVGATQRAGPTGANDVVLLGSPGAGVSRAAALHVPAGHVFVGASSRDPVSYLDRFGLDPTHERFGAVRFRAEDPTRNPTRLDVGDHSKYYRAGTESLANVARVVAGDGARVEPAPYRHELLLRPDGINSDPEADRSPAPIPAPRAPAG